MDVKPLHAVLALAVFGTLLALAAYCGIQASTVQGPTDLQLDRNGDLHLRIGQSLFVYDRERKLRDTYSLDDFQVRGLIGNFDFFPDNSLLLVPDKAMGDLASASGRFLRCYRDGGACAVLPDSEFVFDRSFRVSIVEPGLVYLADTRRGRVYLLDEQGTELNRLGGRLDRPNRVRPVAGGLAIAHTEGREVIVVPLENGRFAAEAGWQRILVKSPPGHSIRRNMPLDFFYNDGKWWVLARPVNMRSGVLLSYDGQGALQSQIRLPADVDPFAIAPLGEHIAVADYEGLAVRLYGLDGTARGELTSPEQAAHIDTLRQRQSLYRAAQYLCWALFALALVAGFAIAIRAELRRSREKKAALEAQPTQGPAEPTPRPHHLEARVHWLEASKKPLWLLAVVGLLLVAMPVGITVGMPQPEDAKEICTRFTVDVTVWAMTGLLLVVVVPVWWKLRQVVSTRIGIADEWVLVDRGNGPVLGARDEDLLRVANGFMIDGVTIPTGSPQMSLFDKKELEQWLQPRLDRGQSLGPIKQLVWQWRHQRGMFVLTWTLVALGLVVVLGMELGWFEGWFEQWLKTRPECAVLEDAGSGEQVLQVGQRFHSLRLVGLGVVGVAALPGEVFRG